ncbi:MAG: sulfatase-like hydrolase/transferase [Candidatus Omnitrophica bacterium]|nr:sulfatase-like hydrolase/transferase [Candidatus Omnitrophota bacterium]
MNKRVILITIDSLRFDRLKKMVHLYNYRDKSLFYNNCYTAGEPTEISFPAIMGSLYASQFMQTISFPEKRKTIAQALKEAGLKTFALTDGNPWCSSVLGYNRGFDYINDYLLTRSKKTIFSRFCKNVGKIFYPKLLRAYLTGWMLNPKTNIKKIISKALEILKEESGGLFLWMHLMDVHSPYRLSSAPFNSKNVTSLRTYSKLSSIPNKVKITKQDIANITWMYDLAVKFLDNELDKLLKYYFSSEYEKGTSLIVTADHGEELGERGNFYHMENVYEEVTHVPLMIFNKNFGSKVIENYCSLRDIPKTILGFLGVEDDYFFGANILREFSDYAISETLKPCMNILMKDKSFNEALKIKLSEFAYAYNDSQKTFFFDRAYYDKDLRQIDSSQVPVVFREHVEARNNRL